MLLNTCPSNAVTLHVAGVLSLLRQDPWKQAPHPCRGCKHDLDFLCLIVTLFQVSDSAGHCVECGLAWNPVRVVRSGARGEGWVVARPLPKRSVGNVRDPQKLSVCLYGASCAKGASCTFAHSQGELELWRLDHAKCTGRSAPPKSVGPGPYGYQHSHPGVEEALEVVQVPKNVVGLVVGIKGARIREIQVAPVHIWYISLYLCRN